LCAWAPNIFATAPYTSVSRRPGLELIIPVHADLQAIISATAGMTFLVTEFGKPFTAAGFDNWFREQCNMANLRHCSAHGLHKAAARRLAEAGCTEHEIAAITAHASLREISAIPRRPIRSASL
jgi:integrase